MSCNNKSRVLRVLLGFQQEICSFIAASEQCYMSNALWGSYRSTQSTTSKLLWPTDEKLKNLAQRLYTRLRDGNGRYSGFRKSAKSNLSLAQLRILVRDLLLVASRLRPSCLVDCCALTKDLTKLLLASFADENDYYGKVTQIRAVLLDGNVFFVNVDAFIREKMSTGFQPQIVVDVSANLAQPRRMSNSTEVDALRLEALAVWTFKACKQLVSSKLNVLQWTRPPTLNATALAGLLLCYPCVYDMLENKDNICDNWSKQDNCLTMCPLYLLQGAVVLYVSNPCAAICQLLTL